MDRLIPFEKACTLLGAHPNSVRAWEEKGRIRVVYTVGGKRRIPEGEILRLTGTAADSPKGLVAIYARVSSQDQKLKGDLERQAQALRHSRQLQALGDESPLVVMDVGSGLSDRRKGLLRLMKMAQDRALTEIHLAHRDRLTRFGFGYLETYFTAHGIRLVVHEQPGAATPQEELVEDLLSIVTSFSGRLYGLRSHSKARALVEAVKEVVSA